MKKNNSENTSFTDEEIVSLYFSRNESAIDATDKKYGNYLFTIGYNILSDKWDSEECVNDTYFRTWNRIPPEKPNLLAAFLSKAVILGDWHCPTCGADIALENITIVLYTPARDAAGQ